MEIVRRVHQMKEIARQIRARGQRIAFVPTMGGLHEGHLRLVRAAAERAEIVVVSIFVNPTQFGPHEDFARYPRDLARDSDLCIAEGVDFLFAPPTEELYPPGPPTWVEVEGLSGRIEGASRPGHFRGVTTVVLKLFAVVQPHCAVFGQKDAQQALLVRRMTRDLFLDVEIVVVPTVRDAQGLALSSRNSYLSAAERAAALAVPRALEAARRAAAAAAATPDSVVAAARAELAGEPLLGVDYVELVDPETLEPAATLGDAALLLVAVHCGSIRLLDNTTLRS